MHLTLKLIAVAALGSAARADGSHEPGTQPAVPSDQSRLELTFTPGAWLPRLGGEATLGPAAGAEELSIEDAFDLDSSEASFTADLALRKDDTWQLNLTGFDFSTSSS